MATGWFIVPYDWIPPGGPFGDGPLGNGARHCGMFAATEGMKDVLWAEVEIAGDQAIVKVVATNAQLETIGAKNKFRRLPVNQLDETLLSTSTAAKASLKQEFKDAGYTDGEILGRFGDNDLGQYTLREVLKFLAQRKVKPRLDKETGKPVFDGEVVPIDYWAIDSLDSRVSVRGSR